MFGNTRLLQELLSKLLFGEKARTYCIGKYIYFIVTRAPELDIGFVPGPLFFKRGLFNLSSYPLKLYIACSYRMLYALL